MLAPFISTIWQSVLTGKDAEPLKPALLQKWLREAKGCDANWEQKEQGVFNGFLKKPEQKQQQESQKINEKQNKHHRTKRDWVAWVQLGCMNSGKGPAGSDQKLCQRTSKHAAVLTWNWRVTSPPHRKDPFRVCESECDRLEENRGEPSRDARWALPSCQAGHLWFTCSHALFTLKSVLLLWTLT